VDNQTNINPEIKKSYLDAISHDTKLITAAWPILNGNNKIFYNKDFVDQLYKDNKVITCFTRQADPKLKQIFSSDSVLFDSSSWIMLEPERYSLARVLVDFIKT
jgi:hypothetical protein